MPGKDKWPPATHELSAAAIFRENNHREPLVNHTAKESYKAWYSATMLDDAAVQGISIDQRYLPAVTVSALNRLPHAFESFRWQQSATCERLIEFLQILDRRIHCAGRK